jgi:hypothetical protein
MDMIQQMRDGATADPPDDAANGVWMTKADLAGVRRISVASADRLIRRQGWRKEPGNDGRARVLVPRTWVGPRRPGPADRTAADPTDSLDAPRGDPSDNTRPLSVLQAAILTLRELLDRERARADRAEAAREMLAARLAETEARLEYEHGRVDQAARAEAQLGQLWDQARREAEAMHQARHEAEAALAAARAGQDKAEAEIAVVRRAEADRRARGLAARLRAAWRGD